MNIDELIKIAEAIRDEHGGDVRVCGYRAEVVSLELNNNDFPPRVVMQYDIRSCSIREIMLRELQRTVEIGNGLYLRIAEIDSFKDSHYREFSCSTAEAAGGAYSQFATGFIGYDDVCLKVRTIDGILENKRSFKGHTFYTYDPEFPDNMLNFICDTAKDADHAFKSRSAFAARRRKSKYHENNQ